MLRIDAGVSAGNFTCTNTTVPLRYITSPPQSVLCKTWMPCRLARDTGMVRTSEAFDRSSRDPLSVRVRRAVAQEGRGL